jgi:hypoxanthine phosphoribosyltransferase
MDDSGVTMNHVYQFLDKESEIITPTEEDSKKIINYEQIIKERDQDLQRLNM